MNARATMGVEALTEKEKQTLRLIVRGHDAKSIARSLDLSVHTVNERLRDVRRKMAVSSSREAARLLFDREGDTPDSLGDETIGEVAARPGVEQAVAPAIGGRPTRGRAFITIGATFMTLALGLFALMALPQSASPPTREPAASVEAANIEVVESARRFLVLLDQSRWDESYAATGAAFRKLNTSQVWASASERVRAQFGAATSRTLLSQEHLPAPPSGYEVVKFRTRFAKGADAVETVSLDRENGVWRVVGVTIG